MVALADYLDLRFAVSDHVGSREISDVMPRLVKSAESWLDKRLRCRQQITAVTLTFASGASPLPADFIEMLHVFSPHGGQLRAGTLAEVKRPYSGYSTYAVDGSNVYINGLTGDRDIDYYAKLPTLTAGPSTSNWLLDAAPDVYLYAVGLEAAKFLKNVDLSQATSALLDDAMMALKIDDDRARWSNSVVRVQGLTP